MSDDKPTLTAYEAVCFLMKARNLSWEDADALLKKGIASGALPTYEQLDNGFLRLTPSEEALKKLGEE
jgi:hypothetical protein